MLWRLTESIWEKELANIGAHKDSLTIFRQKSSIIPLKLGKVRTPAANILKQEMLAIGGDTVTPINTILGKGDYVDVILLGTERQYRILIDKLSKMPFFGLDGWKQELQEYLSAIEPRTVLANGKILDYNRTMVMGIVNVTPDSFYSQSRVKEKDVLDFVEIMLRDGADILDIGGESTRLGAKTLTATEELERVMPALEMIRKAFPKVVISIDTSHAETAVAVIEAGADIINDVSGGSSDMLDVVKKNNVPYVLTYSNHGSILDTAEWLATKSKDLDFGKDKLILDPGIGFGKTTEENIEILGNCGVVTSLGYPVLLGASRKSVIGNVLNLPPEERLEGTLAVSAVAVNAGVKIIRVHDVLENVRCIRMAETLK